MRVPVGPRPGSPAAPSRRRRIERPPGGGDEASSPSPASRPLRLHGRARRGLARVPVSHSGRGSPVRPSRPSRRVGPLHSPQEAPPGDPRRIGLLPSLRGLLHPVLSSPSLFSSLDSAVCRYRAGCRRGGGRPYPVEVAGADPPGGRHPAGDRRGSVLRRPREASPLSQAGQPALPDGRPSSGPLPHLPSRRLSQSRRLLLRTPPRFRPDRGDRLPRHRRRLGQTRRGYREPDPAPGRGLAGPDPGVPPEGGRSAVRRDLRSLRPGRAGRHPRGDAGTFYRRGDRPPPGHLGRPVRDRGLSLLCPAALGPETLRNPPPLGPRLQMGRGADDPVPSSLRPDRGRRDLRHPGHDHGGPLLRLHPRRPGAEPPPHPGRGGLSHPPRLAALFVRRLLPALLRGRALDPLPPASPDGLHPSEGDSPASGAPLETDRKEDPLAIPS